MEAQPEESDITATFSIDAAGLKTYLSRCGYDAPLLRTNHPFESAGQNLSVAWAAFSQNPPDARSACLAAADLARPDETAASAFRNLGAPVLFGCIGGRLHWYQHEAAGTRLLEVVEGRNIAGFFEAHRDEFAPQRVFRAKTSAKFIAGQQLDFVDVGLMPMLERQSGERLGKMVESLLQAMHGQLTNVRQTKGSSRWLFQSAFWLLAARILRDKSVPSFKTVDVTDPTDVFARVSRHYQASAPSLTTSHEHAALRAAGQRAAQLPLLANITTEALAYVYENTLVSEETREALGTHSTPPWLVDYIVWQLAPWIEELPPGDRHILEPACGHAAFLVASLRLLRELDEGSQDDRARLRYLREHIHGVEVDDFAREIGRLSLTLADVPNSDGWNLLAGDMFAGDQLAKQTKRAGVVLSNPPFEDFTAQELRHYRRAAGLGVHHKNKSVELLTRIVDNLPAKAVFGLIVPQAVLVSSNAKRLRERLLRNFEFREICLFPDKVFENSDVESAVLLGRRRTPVTRSSVCYRRVREWDMEGFRERLEPSAQVCVPQSGFLLAEDYSLKLPDLAEVWDSLRSLPRLEELVLVQKGFEFKGKEDLKGREVESPKRRAGWRQGLLRVDDHPIWRLPGATWIDYSSETLRERGGGAKPGLAQVIVNYSPVSRKPWRLKAAIDPSGHPVASRFLVFRPMVASLTLELLWAILNSPLANAYAFSVSGKRQTLPKEWRRMPLPRMAEPEIASITHAAARYRQLAEASESAFMSGPDETDIRHALKAMDAEVLRAYHLPPQLEYQILSLFDGVDRPGVGCSFTGYQVAAEAPHLPYYLQLKLDRFHELASAQLAGRLSPSEAKELRDIEQSLDDYESHAASDHPFHKWLRSFDRRQAATRARLADLENRVNVLQEQEGK